MGSGTVIPHGVYDVGRNEGYVHLNTSHDTSELACDSIAAWWEDQGRAAYPRAKKLLVLCDGGGSNSATRYLFKEELQRLANRLGIEIRVAHYPPYCSKYNPIEHRLFPHVTRACQGVIFQTLETVRHFMAKAETSTGLGVDGEHPGEGVRDGAEVRRGIQGDHEDRLRRDPAQVELPGRPRARVKSGSYSRPIPKWPRGCGSRRSIGSARRGGVAGQLRCRSGRRSPIQVSRPSCVEIDRTSPSRGQTRRATAETPSRLSLPEIIPFIVRNNATSGLPILNPNNLAATTTKSHSGFGDMSFTPRFLLHETKDFSLTAEWPW